MKRLPNREVKFSIFINLSNRISDFKLTIHRPNFINNLKNPISTDDMRIVIDGYFMRCVYQDGE